MGTIEPLWVLRPSVGSALFGVTRQAAQPGALPLRPHQENRSVLLDLSPTSPSGRETGCYALQGGAPSGRALRSLKPTVSTGPV